MSSFNQRECLGCGQPCDGLYCYLCTCQQCGVSLTNGIYLNCTYRDGKPLTCCECEGPLRGGFCWFCDSRDETSFANDPNSNSFDDSQHLSNYSPQPQYETYLCELCGNDSHYGYDCPPRFPLESTLLLNEINSQIPPSIVITTSLPVLPTEDLEDSLIMRNEDLNTIPKKESVEFIKSSVEDLVPISCEFEDTSESESVDDELLSDEDIPEDNDKIYSNPLFECNDEYISSDVNPLFDEVLEDIECKDSYYPNLDESTFLVTPFSDLNKDEYFTLGDDVELLFHHDPSIPKMSIAFILEGFIDEPPLEENDDLFDLEYKNDDWKKILIALDLEASRACGFIHRPLELQSLAYGNPIS
nr:hypothetical protein [Tanacetum cinerariifolium]